MTERLKSYLKGEIIANSHHVDAVGSVVRLHKKQGPLTLTLTGEEADADFGSVFVFRYPFFEERSKQIEVKIPTTVIRSRNFYLNDPDEDS